VVVEEFGVVTASPALIQRRQHGKSPPDGKGIEKDRYSVRTLASEPNADLCEDILPVRALTDGEDIEVRLSSIGHIGTPCVGTQFRLQIAGQSLNARPK
jgi:hypothetical protein